MTVTLLLIEYKDVWIHNIDDTCCLHGCYVIFHFALSSLLLMWLLQADELNCNFVFLGLEGCSKHYISHLAEMNKIKW